MNDLEQRRALRALRVDLQPQQDLWSGIEARLQPRSSRIAAWPWSLALAASVLLAVPLLLQWHSSLTRPLSPHTLELVSMEREADAMMVQYRAAMAELSATPLPGELQPLADALERDVEALRAALSVHPQSVDLLHQLRRTYDQRVRLGQRVALG